MIDSIVKGIFEKKGQEVVHIDLRQVENAICDSFVICSGESSTQVNAIAESIEKETTEALHVSPLSVEGMQNGEWVLLDYGEAIVHVFQRPVREYYKLEELWGDGAVIPVHETIEKKI